MNNKIDYKTSLQMFGIFLIVIIIISIESNLIQLIFHLDDSMLINVIEKSIITYIIYAVMKEEYNLHTKEILNEGNFSKIDLVLSILGTLIVVFLIYKPQNMFKFFMPMINFLTRDHSIFSNQYSLLPLLLYIFIIPIQNTSLYYGFVLKGLINNNKNIYLSVLFISIAFVLINILSGQYLIFLILGIYFGLVFLKTESILLIFINNTVLSLFIIIKNLMHFKITISSTIFIPFFAIIIIISYYFIKKSAFDT